MLTGDQGMYKTLELLPTYGDGQEGPETPKKSQERTSVDTSYKGQACGAKGSEALILSSQANTDENSKPDQSGCSHKQGGDWAVSTKWAWHQGDREQAAQACQQEKQ